MSLILILDFRHSNYQVEFSVLISDAINHVVSQQGKLIINKNASLIWSYFQNCQKWTIFRCYMVHKDSILVHCSDCMEAEGC